MGEALKKLKDDPKTPLLLRKIEKKPEVAPITASHMTVVTTAGMSPEMHDQTEDRYR